MGDEAWVVASGATMESWGSVGLSNFRHASAGGYPTILLQPKLGSRMRGNDGWG